MSDQSLQNQNTTGHDFDGITEYDNPTPGWWTWLFIATIVFSAVYFVYYHAGAPSRTLADSFAASKAQHTRLRFADMGTLVVNEANMVSWMNNKEYMGMAEGTFKQNCVSCHGQNGEGLVGPNLTDNTYIHVKKLTDIASVVLNGAANNAMPSQKQMHPNDIALVSAYVASLRGKNLATGTKAKFSGPEVEIKPWPTAAETQAATKKK